MWKGTVLPARARKSDFDQQVEPSKAFEAEGTETSELIQLSTSIGGVRNCFLKR